eukprot:Colp12_sorted_trinity150504_noHs@24472
MSAACTKLVWYLLNDLDTLENFATISYLLFRHIHRILPTVAVPVLGVRLDVCKTTLNITQVAKVLIEHKINRLRHLDSGVCWCDGQVICSIMLMLHHTVMLNHIMVMHDIVVLHNIVMLYYSVMLHEVLMLHDIVMLHHIMMLHYTVRFCVIDIHLARIVSPNTTRPTADFL